MRKTRVFRNPDAKKFSVRVFERNGEKMWYIRLWFFCVVYHSSAV